MGSEAEIVVAAEAVRTWVRAQRATWAPPLQAGPARAGVLARTPAPPITFRPQTVAVPPLVADPANAALPPAALTGAPTPAVPTPVAPTPIAPTPSALATPSLLESARADDTLAQAALDAGRPYVDVEVTTAVPTGIPVMSPVPDRASLFAIARAAVFSRGGMRVAVGLVIVGVLAGGGLAARSAWTWYKGLPRIGTATFDSVPPGAQVLVDGHAVGTTPMRLELPAGPHAVEFRSKAANRTQDIDVVKGRDTAVTVDWNPRRVGRLQVISAPPGARVMIDGRDRGATPLSVDDVAIGPHSVVIESSEGSVRRKVNITEGEVETIEESIYPGWLHVSAPFDVLVVDGTRGIQLDDRNRVLLKPGVHTLRIENRTLQFSQMRQVHIVPGGTSTVTIDPPLSTLSVTGSSGDQVFVDRVPVGETPLLDHQVKLGPHDVMVVQPSGNTRHVTVTVTSQPAQVEIDFSRR